MQMFGRWTVIAVLVSCSGLLLSADDEKKNVKLPDAVKSAWNKRFHQAEIVQVKSKDEGFEIKAKDELNEDFKVTYSADGRIVQEKCTNLEVSLELPQSLCTLTVVQR